MDVCIGAELRRQGTHSRVLFTVVTFFTPLLCDIQFWLCMAVARLSACFGHAQVMSGAAITINQQPL
jgi:hypothetical protein